MGTERSRGGDLQSTTRKSEQPRPRLGRAKVPCLTVLCHPDWRRIGQRALLSALLAGRKVALSRLEPLFAAPGSSGAVPLEDPYLSRKPIYLTSTRPIGGVTIEATNGEVVVDGAPLDDARICSPEQLAAGLVLVLGGRVALLLHQTSNPPLCPIDGIVGCSDAIALVRQEIAQIAATDVPVLVRGETGTGKECVARAIRDASGRAGHPWIAVNMATLTESTAVSTLFGHVKGAFTGAHQRHRGLFEQASQGTLFLDEIGETPENVQSMLLRTLETGTILPLGEESERRVDVRVIAATDAPLELDMNSASFRAALFHRLAGYEIHVPPLRERRDDIARLFVHFLTQELGTLGRASLLTQAGERGEPSLPLDIVTRLVGHPLPGNVRQLRNVARHLAIGSQNEAELVVTPALERLLALELDPAVADPGAGSSPPSRRPAEITDRDLLAALEQSDWSPGRAARHLGIATSTLQDLMRRHGIRRASDLSDAEQREAHQRLAGNPAAMAAELRVSERALRLTLRQRGLLEED
jgi:two-component system nitrogen regulation response regulator GlnG